MESRKIAPFLGSRRKRENIFTFQRDVPFVRATAWKKFNPTCRFHRLNLLNLRRSKDIFISHIVLGRNGSRIRVAIDALSIRINRDRYKGEGVIYDL